MKLPLLITLLASTISFYLWFGTDLILSTSFEQKKLPEAPKAKNTPILPTLHPVLVPICACESTGNPNITPTHYEKDGVTVRRGRENNLDVGICQVNLYWHENEATRLGLDLMVEADNITYANRLYEQKGVIPWGWSSRCWQKSVNKILGVI